MAAKNARRNSKVSAPKVVEKQDTHVSSKASEMFPMASPKSASTYSLNDFIFLMTAFFCAYQFNIMQKEIDGQHVRIAQLEALMSASAKFNSTIAAYSSNDQAVESEALYQGFVEDVYGSVNHEPHSHYNIPTIDGIPVEQDREYYMKDFFEVFHVEPLFDVEEQPSATPLLSDNIVWFEPYYRNNFHDIAPLVSQATAFMKNLAPIDNMRVCVKWESKETGFGLYAKDTFGRGEIVGLYTGELYAAWDHLDIDLDTDYTWEYPSDTGDYPTGVTFGVDGLKKGNYLRFANHVGAESNTKPYFIPYNNRWHIFYVAVKDIKVGDAITSDYGADYFDARPMA